MKTLIDVEIFGQTFTMSSEDEADYMKEVAAFVDQRIRQMNEHTKSNLGVRVAIMAALSIADDYLKARKRESETSQQVEELSAKLLSRLEKSETLEPVTTAPEPSLRNFPSTRASQE
ncbi:MAG: cell division protein ZapA [Candidatus Binatia bacterium]